jgi:HK97 gp10 family phage protein
MAKAELTFKGRAELEAALRDLGGKIATRLSENAVRAGIRVIAGRARSSARWTDRTGKLRASIRVLKDMDRPAGSRTAYAGSRDFRAIFFEFGTVKMAARPFMRPAIDEGGPAAVDKMVQNLAGGIERETAKHGKGGK